MSRAITEFNRGTVLEDMIAYIQKWRDNQGEHGFFPVRDVLGAVGTLVGPEALEEYARMQGAAVAVTRLNAQNEPEIVAVLLNGQSNFPGFILRMFLSVESGLRSAAVIEGVTIYGFRSMIFQQVIPGGAPPAPQAPTPLEPPYIARMPGAIILGSSVDSVGDVVKRLKTTEPRPALSTEAFFQEASALRQRPGVFVYAHPDRVMQAFDSIEDEELQRARRMVAAMVNPRAIRNVAANLSLVTGAIDLQLTMKLERGQSSSLVELFSGPNAIPSMLHAVPKDAIGAFTLTMNDGEQQWQRFVTAADAAASEGEPIFSRTGPSNRGTVQALVRERCLRRIQAITVAFPQQQELPRGAKDVPMVIVTATDEANAEKLEALIAPLIGAVMGELVEPVAERIAGVRVRSIPGAGLPWQAPLHFGRRGSTLVFGVDRKLVAASLTGTPGDSLARQVPTDGSMVGLWRWSHHLPEWLATGNRPNLFEVPGEQPMPDVAKMRESIEKFRKANSGLVAQMPPLEVSAVRTEGELTIRVRQRHSIELRAKMIQTIFDTIMEQATNPFENAGILPAVPVAPVPIKN